MGRSEITLSARKATGHQYLGMAVKNGKIAIANHVKNNGRYEPVYLTSFLPPAEADKVMAEIAKTGRLPL